jgi:hypothetical protein
MAVLEENCQAINASLSQHPSVKFTNLMHQPPADDVTESFAILLLPLT